MQSSEVKSVVKEMTDFALNNYEEIRPLWKKGCVGRNKEFERLILLGSPSLLYLEQLKKKKYDVTGRRFSGVLMEEKSLSSPFMNVRLQNRLLKQKSFNRY